MARFSTKHEGREKTFSTQGFADGLNLEVSPSFLPVTALSQCKNMKYAINKSLGGEPKIVLKKRQGTEVISTKALTSAADVLACTYYIAGSKYILATASKIYYLDGSYEPVEIGSINGIPTFTEFHEKLIIHDSGVTKAWDGTTFETLNGLVDDEIVGTGDNAVEILDEVIETGDDLETEFAGTFAHTDVKASSVTIEYTDATAKVIVDDGDGRLTGDISSGVVKDITAITKADPCVITCMGHGRETGDLKNIQDVGGMIEINDASYVITKITDNTFSIPIDSTDYTTYTSAGTASGNAIQYSSGKYLFTASGAPDAVSIYATYNYAKTEFDGTLDHPVVKVSSLTIEYSDATAMEITDDGVGKLIGDVADMDKDISGASKAAACVITCTGHGFATNDIINIQDVGGMVEINDASYVITKINDNSFSIPINSTGFTTYTSSGTASSNAIQYSSGKYLFTCSGAPDNTTTVYATYEEVGGAPKSITGFVRAAKLYMLGDSDNTSRLWYSSANDEDAWANSTSGGYLDVDPLDGYELTGCLNFYQSLILIKENSLHRLDNFPGDATFRVEPLMTDLGCVGYKTAMNDGALISFLSNEGWIGMASSERYGDIMKATDLDEKFKSRATRYANRYAYSEYNQLDKQLWLTLYDDVNSAYLPDIYVLNLQTGGQLSLYEFAFTHSCYKYVNGEMLIGGTDGNLYRLFESDSRFKDNAVAYDSHVRGAMTDWGAAFNRKHNKKLFPYIYGKVGMTATLTLYKDGDYNTSFYSTDLEVPNGDALIFDGRDVLIYDCDGEIGAIQIDVIKKKFNYEEVMFSLTDIEGALGAEFYGLDMTGAIVGG